MIQPNTIPGSLSWSHINNREYQLHREGLVLATLNVTVAQSEPTLFRAAQNSNFDKSIY
jgi:hypothetical protein